MSGIIHSLAQYLLSIYDNSIFWEKPDSENDSCISLIKYLRNLILLVELRNIRTHQHKNYCRQVKLMVRLEPLDPKIWSYTFIWPTQKILSVRAGMRSTIYKRLFWNDVLKVGSSFLPLLPAVCAMLTE